MIAWSAPAFYRRLQDGGIFCVSDVWEFSTRFYVERVLLFDVSAHMVENTSFADSREALSAIQTTTHHDRKNQTSIVSTRYDYLPCIMAFQTHIPDETQRATLLFGYGYPSYRVCNNAQFLTSWWSATDLTFITLILIGWLWRQVLNLMSAFLGEQKIWLDNALTKTFLFLDFFCSVVLFSRIENCSTPST